MDPESRLRLAQRIDLGLQRVLGMGIDSTRMVGDRAYAREVLYVCEGSGDDTLQALAAEYQGGGSPAPKPRPLTAKMRVMPSPEELARRRATRSTPAEGAHADPSSSAAGLAPPPPDEAFDEGGGVELPRWLNPRHWLRRGVRSKP